MLRALRLIEEQRAPYPTTRDLAQIVGFSVSTTHKACKALAAEELVTHHCGWGLARPLD